MARSPIGLFFHYAFFCYDLRPLPSEYEGRVLQQGSFVFLKPLRLAQILKPIFNHKHEVLFNGDINLRMSDEEPIVLSTHHQKILWRRLSEKGILDIELARIIWPNGLANVVLPILKRMDLAFPLGSNEGELVVMQGLPASRPALVEGILNGFPNNYSISEGSWRLFGGAPPGVIENVLTRCCTLGDTRMFWRYGVLVRGDLDGYFALILDFVDNETLKLQVYGNPESVGPWMALSFAMSAALSKMSEFPGLEREAKLRCPTHSKEFFWISDEVNRILR